MGAVICGRVVSQANATVAGSTPCASAISVIAEREPILRATGRLVYARFHNADPAWRYGGSFSDEALAWWADRFRELTAHGRPAYVYFNNDNFGYAAFNARTLKGMLGT